MSSIVQHLDYFRCRHYLLLHRSWYNQGWRYKYLIPCPKTNSCISKNFINAERISHIMCIEMFIKQLTIITECHPDVLFWISVSSNQHRQHLRPILFPRSVAGHINTPVSTKFKVPKSNYIISLFINASLLVIITS